MVRTTDMSDKWKIIAESIIGHSHVRKNLPNQDAYTYSGDNGEYPIISSIADGHGGKDYFRSDRGSRFACDAAIASLSNYYYQDPTFSTPHMCDAICKEILKEWKTYILEDIRKYPFSGEESEIIEGGKSSRKFNLPMDPDYEQIRPYGSTVLAVIITKSYAVFFQLGDGDIISYGSQDHIFSKVIPADDNMIGNETYSLCMPESWRDFKVKRLEPVPEFIMLSTDGYANSFVDESGFITAARDLHSFFYKAEDFDIGVTSVQSNLKEWLTITSQKGSGDDITVCMIVRDTSDSIRSGKE